MKKFVRLTTVFVLVAVSILLNTSTYAQESPTKPLPSKLRASKVVSSIITVDANGRVVSQSMNRDTTSLGVARSADITILPRNTANNGVVSGRAQIWFNSNWIYGEGDTWLNSSNGILYKLEAWTTNLNVNGSVNNSGRLGIKYTSNAFDNIFAGNIGSSSGCLVVNLTGLKRTATVSTTHKRYNGSGTGSPLNNFGNSANLKFSCSGE